jgi:uncharacterized protein YjlB
MEPVEAIQHVNIIRHLIPADEGFPNNALLPLLVYQKAIHIPDEGDQQRLEKQIIELFETNEWVNAWVDSVYTYHHFHSTAHEVLGVVKGSARIQFGGPNGIGVLLEAGDAVVIPAGVAHKAIDLYDDFLCIGAYPAGQDYDIRKGELEEINEVNKNIKSLELPLADPIYGVEGPLMMNWKL